MPATNQMLKEQIYKQCKETTANFQLAIQKGKNALAALQKEETADTQEKCRGAASELRRLYSEFFAMQSQYHYQPIQLEDKWRFDELLSEREEVEALIKRMQSALRKEKEKEEQYGGGGNDRISYELQFYVRMYAALEQMPKFFVVLPVFSLIALAAGLSKLLTKKLPESKQVQKIKEWSEAIFTDQSQRFQNLETIENNLDEKVPEWRKTGFFQSKENQENFISQFLLVKTPTTDQGDSDNSSNALTEELNEDEKSTKDFVTAFISEVGISDDHPMFAGKKLEEKKKAIFQILSGFSSTGQKEYKNTLRLFFLKSHLGLNLEQMGQSPEADPKIVQDVYDKLQNIQNKDKDKSRAQMLGNVCWYLMKVAEAPTLGNHGADQMYQEIQKAALKGEDFWSVPLYALGHNLEASTGNAQGPKKAGLTQNERHLSLPRNH